MSGATDLARFTTLIDTANELMLTDEIKMMDVGDGVQRPTNAKAISDLAAQMSGAMIYTTTALGLAGTVNGSYFSVLSTATEGYVDLYRNNAGAAVLVDTYPSVDAVREVQGIIARRIDAAAEVERLTVADQEGGAVLRITDKRISTQHTDIIGEAGGATILGDSEGGAAFYSDATRTIVGPMEFRPTDLPGIYFTSPDGDIFPRGEGGDSGLTPLPFLDGLLFQSVIATAGDSDIYVPGLLGRRELESSVVATLASTTGPAISSGRRLRVNAAEFGPEAVLNLRSTADYDARHFMTLTLKNVPVQSPAVPVSVLILSDSIGQNEGAVLLDLYLRALGFTPTFIGTMPSNGTTAAQGLVGETRSGWETGDYTNAITDRAIILPPGQESAYMAMNIFDKRDRNVFARAATGSDPTEIVRNGYVFDPAFYQSRFNLGTPQIVFNGLGTNNARDRGVNEVYAQTYADDLLMHRQIKAAWPDAKIIRSIPGTSSNSERNALWTSHYVKIIRAMQAAARDSANSNITIAPLWAMTDPEAGYLLPTAAPGTDGFIEGNWSDPIHPYGAPRHNLYKALAPFVAAARLGLI